MIKEMNTQVKEYINFKSILNKMARKFQHYLNLWIIEVEEQEGTQLKYTNYIFNKIIFYLKEDAYNDTGIINIK